MGPLAGLRIVELGGIGPGPFASMLLSEMGADVLRIARRRADGINRRRADGVKGLEARHQLLNRGRRAVAMDLKNRRAIDAVERLIARSTPSSKASGPASRSAWGSARTNACGSTRSWSMAWCEIMTGAEVCVAPVLSMAEAPQHPHMKARGTFLELDGVVQPAPAPRFSRTRPEIRHSAGSAGQQADDALGDWGFSPAEVAALRACGALV